MQCGKLGEGLRLCRAGDILDDTVALVAHRLGLCQLKGVNVDGNDEVEHESDREKVKAHKEESSTATRVCGRVLEGTTYCAMLLCLTCCPHDCVHDLMPVARRHHLEECLVVVVVVHRAE